MSHRLVCPPPAGCNDAAFLRALDVGAIAALTQRLLCRDVSLASLRGDYVRWKGDDGALIGYRASLRAGVETREGYVTVRCAAGPRLAAEADRLQHRADEVHDGMRAFALTPERDLLLLASPIDRAMHDLRWLLRASRVRNLLLGVAGDWLPAGQRISKSRSVGTIVRYKPERRAVVRWDLALLDEGSGAVSPRTAWLRCHAGPQARRTATATAAAAAGGVRCPRTLGMVHDRLAIEAHVEGTPWRPFQAREQAAMASRVGAVVARLHDAERPSGLPVHGAVSDLDRTLRAVEDLGRLRPSLGERARALAEQLAHEVPPDGPPVLAHGDLHPEQVLLGGDVALVDFDRACLAPVEHDLSTLYAHALLAADVAGRELGVQVLDGYRRGGGVADAGAQRWWRTSALVRVAALPFRQLRADWPQRAERLLVLAAAEFAAPDREVGHA